MDCPDANLIAAMQERRLSNDDVAKLLQHIDSCQECLEVALMVRCIDEAPGASQQLPSEGEQFAPNKPPRRPSQWTGRDELALTRVLTIGLLGLTHLFWSWSFVPLTWHARFSAALSPCAWGHGSITQVAIDSYIMSWGTLGLGLGSIALIGAMRRSAWSGLTIRIYAMTTFPSLVLAPLGICLWIQSTDALAAEKE
ncbi:MAG TPA: hypothetical protein VIV60_13150 [Polyangiaceae bacterium]